MSFSKAYDYLKQYNLTDRIKEFELSSATVTLAAQCLGCEEREIAKSLTFLVDNEPIMILASGDKKIDNAKFKATFNTKACMIDRDNVEKLVGHAVGGVCPFGINDGVKVYLDISLKELTDIYPACGSSNSAVKLNLVELEQISNYLNYIDVCKNVE